MKVPLIRVITNLVILIRVITNLVIFELLFNSVDTVADFLFSSDQSVRLHKKLVDIVAIFPPFIKLGVFLFYVQR